MKPHKTLRLLMLVLVFAAIGACREREGAFEKAGKQVDKSIDDAGDAVEEAGDEIEDATDENR